MWKSSRIPILGAIAGVLAGYLVFHPYTMLVYVLTHPSPGGQIHFHWQDLMTRSLEAFQPVMIPMAFPFILFGGATGLLLGILAERTKRLYEQRLENEKQRAAHETLQQLMVTLSHYLLNANMIIGGNVRHCRKVTSDEEVLSSLDVIEKQGRKIDTVISTLRHITEIKTSDYTTDGHVRMIDIEKEIEARLNQSIDKQHPEI